MSVDSQAIRATSRAQSAAWSRRLVPAIEEVRAGVWAIPVPVPSIPIRYTYAYLLIGTRESVLIDPGDGSEQAWQALTRGFTEIGFAREDLTGIVVTHYHFDHWEGADRLAAATGAWVAMSGPECGWVRGLTDAALTHEVARDRFMSWGAPEAEAELLAATEDYGDTRANAEPQIILDDGDRLPLLDADLIVRLTPGHSPGHICLYDESRNLLFSGDHLLPEITPHIALNPFGDVDPLGQYLDSLEIVSAYDGAEVLPAHEYRFTGVATRIAQLRQGIERRLDEVRDIVVAVPTATIWEIAQQLTWSRGWGEFSSHSRRMAFGEAASHVELLRARGEFAAASSAPGVA